MRDGAPGRLFMPALMAVQMLEAAFVTMPVPGLVHWQRLSGDPIQVGWIIAAYLLTASISAAIFGRLGDLRGRVRMLAIALSCCIAGSAIAAVGPTLGWIIVGRALQGAAGATQPLAYGLLRARLPEERVPFAIGLLVAMSAFGTAFGFLLGGVMTQFFGPQSMFLASGVLSAAILALLLIGVPRLNESTTEGRVDWLGAGLLVPPIALMLFAAGKIANWDTASGTITVALAIGIVVLIAWVVHELRVKNPLIDLRLLGRRNAIMANLAMIFAALGVFQFGQLITMMLLQPQWTGVGMGLSPSVGGALNFGLVGTGIIGAMVSGWLGARAGSSRFPLIAGLCLALASGLLSIFMHSSMPPNLLAVVGSVCGLSMAYAAIPNIIMSATSAERTGEAIGVMTVLRSVAMAVGAQVLAILLATSQTSRIGAGSYPDEGAFVRVMVFMTVTCAVALVAAFLVRKAVPAASQPL